jgi:hypothetical protein
MVRRGLRGLAVASEPTSAVRAGVGDGRVGLATEEVDGRLGRVHAMHGLERLD